MTYRYFRCDWSHNHSDDPIVIYYEVDVGGKVPRMIEIFADGRCKCISTADFVGREHEMVGIDSLVEGEFDDRIADLPEGVGAEDGSERISLKTVGSDPFEAEWRNNR